MDVASKAETDFRNPNATRWLAPGATETEQFRTGKSEELIGRLSSMSAFNRLGRVEDIADVVAFFRAMMLDG